MPGQEPGAPTAEGFAGSAAAYKVPPMERAWVYEEGGPEIPEPVVVVDESLQMIKSPAVTEDSLEEEEEEEHLSLKGTFIDENGGELELLSECEALKCQELHGGTPLKRIHLLGIFLYSVLAVRKFQLKGKTLNDPMNSWDR